VFSMVISCSLPNNSKRPTLSSLITLTFVKHNLAVIHHKKFAKRRYTCRRMTNPPSTFYVTSLPCKMVIRATTYDSRVCKIIVFGSLNPVDVFNVNILKK